MNDPDALARETGELIKATFRTAEAAVVLSQILWLGTAIAVACFAVQLRADRTAVRQGAWPPRALTLLSTTHRSE
jgi:hypothetical protein